MDNDDKVTQHPIFEKMSEIAAAVGVLNTEVVNLKNGHDDIKDKHRIYDQKFEDITEKINDICVDIGTIKMELLVKMRSRINMYAIVPAAIGLIIAACGAIIALLAYVKK